MKKQRLWKAVLFVLMVAVLALSGYNARQKAKEQAPAHLKRIRLLENSRTVFYAPQYVAIRKGFFKEAGIKLEVITAENESRLVDALTAKHADIALSGPETAIFLYSQNPDGLIANFAQLTCRHGAFLVARKPMPDFVWSNVKGKVIIGKQRGTMPEIMLEHALVKNGIIPNKNVEIINSLNPAATANAFKRGIGDYTMEFEPAASVLERDGAGYIVASVGEKSQAAPFAVYMSTVSYIKENPVLLHKFTEAIARGETWVAKNNPQKIAAEIAPFFPGVTHDALVKAIGRYKSINVWPSTPAIQQKSFEELLQIMVDQGELAKKVPYESVVDPRFARKDKHAD